jgi:hypothetical protein
MPPLESSALSIALDIHQKHGVQGRLKSSWDTLKGGPYLRIVQRSLVGRLRT